MIQKFLIYNKLGLLNGKYFVKDYCPTNWGINKHEKDILNEGPEHPLYNNIWNNIIDTRKYEIDGIVYKLEEDKNLNLWVVGE